MHENMLGTGVWVKTHIYQQGHMLNAVTYCVAAGNPEILRFSVDLRPLAVIVKRHHERLHKEAAAQKRTNPDKAMQSQKVSGFFDVVEAPFKGIGHAVHKLGRAKLVRAVSGAVAGVAKKAGGIAMAISPQNLVRHVLAGERIDHAILGDLKDKVHAATEIAPYVSTVVSLVPGIGSGVAGAIAASAALAEGHTITDAMIAAARNAVPGGAATAYAFDMAANLARGQSLEKAALEAARNQLPHEAQAAFDIGLAIVHGQKLQNVLKSGVAAVAPAMHLPNVSTSALSAFATAHAAFDAIEKGKDALNAVGKITAAKALLEKLEKASKELKPGQVEASLAAHPALAAKIANAKNVVAAAAHLSPQTVLEAKKNAEETVAKMKAIADAAKHDPDPLRRDAAQRSMQVLEIVAQHRKHVQSVAAAHAGGVPGIRIDAQGRLVKGRWVRGPGASNGYLHTRLGDQGGPGQWSQVNTLATSLPPVLSPPEHATAAAKHTKQARAHAAAAKVAPHPVQAAKHRKAAVTHAKTAAVHKAAAKFSGDDIVGCPVGANEPGLIGCGCA